MLVGGPLSQVVRNDFNQPGVTRSSNDSAIDCFAEKLGKNRDDIEA
jgi:hypothetical protein